MFGLFDIVKMAGAAVIAGSLAYGVGHWRGYDAGYDAAQAEARIRALALIEKRNQDNEEISDLDAAGLCVELGGEWLRDERRCD